ncbi:unnamed protein product, partial [marine sediment metagenome]
IYVVSLCVCYNGDCIYANERHIVGIFARYPWISYAVFWFCVKYERLNGGGISALDYQEIVKIFSYEGDGHRNAVLYGWI